LLPNVLDEEYSIKTHDGTFTREHNNIFKFEPESSDSDKMWSYEGSESNNWTVINQSKEHIVFVSDNKDDILSLPNSVVRKSLMNFPFEIERGLEKRGFVIEIDRGLEINQELEIDQELETCDKKLRESASMDHIMIHMFFADEKKYTEFAMAYYLERDLEKSNCLFNEKMNEYISEGLKWAQNMNLKDKQWTMGNKFMYPGMSIISARDWYKDSRKPIKVGISDKRLQAFIECYKNIDCFSMLPIELFKMLCSYWLEAEMQEARTRLSVFSK
jgi:hypothetical protein